MLNRCSLPVSCLSVHAICVKMLALSVAILAASSPTLLGGCSRTDPPHPAVPPVSQEVGPIATTSPNGPNSTRVAESAAASPVAAAGDPALRPDGGAVSGAASLPAGRQGDEGGSACRFAITPECLDVVGSGASAKIGLVECRPGDDKEDLPAVLCAGGWLSGLMKIYSRIQVFKRKIWKGAANEIRKCESASSLLLADDEGRPAVDISVETYGSAQRARKVVRDLRTATKEAQAAGLVRLVTFQQNPTIPGVKLSSLRAQSWLMETIPSFGPATGKFVQSIQLLVGRRLYGIQADPDWLARQGKPGQVGGRGSSAWLSGLVTISNIASSLAKGLQKLPQRN